MTEFIFAVLALGFMIYAWWTHCIRIPRLTRRMNEYSDEIDRLIPLDKALLGKIHAGNDFELIDPPTDLMAVDKRTGEILCHAPLQVKNGTGQDITLDWTTDGVLILGVEGSDALPEDDESSHD